MRIHRRIEYSLIIAFVVFALSLFINFVPCQTAPVIPNPQYTWHLCSLNPDSFNALGISRLYFAYTPSLKAAYITLMVAAFIVAFAVLSLLFKSKKD